MYEFQTKIRIHSGDSSKNARLNGESVEQLYSLKEQLASQSQEVEMMSQCYTLLLELKEQDLTLAQELLAQSDATIENLKDEIKSLKARETCSLLVMEWVIKEKERQWAELLDFQDHIFSIMKRGLEKENSLLKTKVDNAIEEYRCDMMIWEEQKKELQLKIDAEVERNCKLKKALLDAYSQVHALKQEGGAASAFPCLCDAFPCLCYTSLAAAVAAISPNDPEKAALMMQVLHLTKEQVAFLPQAQQDFIRALKEKIANIINRIFQA